MRIRKYKFPEIRDCRGTMHRAPTDTKFLISVTIKDRGTRFSFMIEIAIN